MEEQHLPGYLHQAKRGLLLFALVSLFMTACGSSEEISASGPWGRPSPGSAANAAFYVTLHNHTAEVEELVAAESDICAQVELHESAMDENNVMSMRHVEKIVILPGETVQLEPGGLHIMCIDRLVALEPGDLVPIRLHFAKHGELSIEAEIREQ